ncbi:MAG: DUF2207 domain-containing protein [Chloroflexi bacterium]|nr:DUF2207 domain-containing protein [Chloroflexota bacterium]
MSLIRAVTIALALGIVIIVATGPASASAQEGWTIVSFDVTYEIHEDGTVQVTEQIDVDFGTLERHGIFRDIPVEYTYDSDNNRLIELSDLGVDDGLSPIQWTIESTSPNLRIRIGDPNVLVTGEQSYRIQYTINNGLNPFTDHDELFWNVTGNEWPVPIESASATVLVPGDAINDVTCFEGPTGSTAACESAFGRTGATFESTTFLSAGSGLTIVVGLNKGAVEVGPPVLVPATVDPIDEITDFLGLKPLPIGIAIALTSVGLVAVGRWWWIAGRDRWFGNMAHVVADAPTSTKPIGAHETIVVEYEPPGIGSKERERLLRPAEIGLLMDERADTLDVSATIVDLAVRKRLRLKEIERGGVFGLFKSKDYKLERVENAEDSLLPYERRLENAMFDDGDIVKLSDLKNKFHEDLQKVKADLYDDSVSDLKFFPQNPEKVRTLSQIVGAVTAAAGGGLVFVLGTIAGAGIVGVSLIVAGVVLFLFAPAMPRRTATGRRMYRRCIGFRLYMETAEKDRQRFAENENIFHDYLPYAIVYGCVDKWAKVFDDLGIEPKANWYAGRHGFVPLAFASTMNDFSSSISSVMASTPGGSGGSGFGGGGFSGGGGGGGGGGSW